MPEGVPAIGLSLITVLLETEGGGRVFTTRDALRAGQELGLTSGHTYKLLSQMVDREVLDRPRDRLYVMRPPFGGQMPVRPLVVAVHAVVPVAVSGDTALAHWGLMAQAPLHEEVVSTPARVQWRSGVRADGADRLWDVLGSTIRFHRVPDREMFGITSVRLDAESVVPMFDRERALVELLGRRDGAGSEWAVEFIREQGRDVDAARVWRYAEQLGLSLGDDPALPRRPRKTRTAIRA